MYPRVINFKDSNRYYMGRREDPAKVYTSQFPNLLKLRAFLFHGAFEVISNVRKALNSAPHPFPEKI